MLFENCKIINVVDGDTIDVEFDLGFSILTRQRLRLSRIDCPEVTGKTKILGLESEAALHKWIRKDDTLYIETEKKDSFGRYIAEIFYIDSESSFDNLSDWLVGNDFAVYRKY